MSTIAEHVAVLEMLAANNRWDAFHSEGWMFLQVHFRDLGALCGSDAMEQARKTTEQRMREQHPDQADALIAKWHAAKGVDFGDDSYRRSAPDRLQHGSEKK